MNGERRISWRSLSLRGLVLSVLIAAVMGIAAVLGGDFGELQARVLFTTATIGVMSVLGLACGSLLDRTPGHPVGRIGIACSILGALMIFPLIWDFDGGRIYVKCVLSITIFAVAAGHLSLLWLVELAPQHRWAQRGSVVAIAAAAALLLLVIWAELESNPVWRALGVIAIVDAAFTLMVPIFYRLGGGHPAGSSRLAQIDAELAKLQLRIEELQRERAGLGGAA